MNAALVAIVLLFSFVTTAHAQAKKSAVQLSAECSQLAKLEKEHSDWSLKFRGVQTTPFLTPEQTLEKLKPLARPSADRLEQVSKLNESKKSRTNIEILRKTMDRIDKHEYTVKYAARELSNVLPNFEDDTKAAILNAQLKYGCPDLGLGNPADLGSHKSKR